MVYYLLRVVLNQDLKCSIRFSGTIRTGLREGASYIVEFMDFAPISARGPLVLAAVFIALVGLQLWYPLRTVVVPPLRHLLTNVTIGVAAAVPIRWLILPVGLTISAWAQRHRFGI